MPHTTIARDQQVSKYRTRDLAAALSVSPFAFGAILAAGYVTTSLGPVGRGHPRRFTIVDAYQFASFFSLYHYWNSSTSTLGWLIDLLLEHNRVDFSGWPRSPDVDDREPHVPPRNIVVERIKGYARSPQLLSPWYEHTEIKRPFYLFVTNHTLEVTQTPDIQAKDGLLVNLTRALADIDKALHSGRSVARSPGRDRMPG